MTHNAQYSDTREIDGRSYRWDFTFGELEVEHYGSWARSAFGVFVKASHRGEPLVCLDADRPRAERLITAFALDTL